MGRTVDLDRFFGRKDDITIIVYITTFTRIAPEQDLTTVRLEFEILTHLRQDQFPAYLNSPAIDCFPGDPKLKRSLTLCLVQSHAEP